MGEVSQVMKAQEEKSTPGANNVIKPEVRESFHQGQLPGYVMCAVMQASLSTQEVALFELTLCFHSLLQKFLDKGPCIFTLHWAFANYVSGPVSSKVGRTSHQDGKQLQCRLEFSHENTITRKQTKKLAILRQNHKEEKPPAKNLGRNSIICLLDEDE